MPNFQPKILVHFKMAANCSKDIRLTEKNVGEILMCSTCVQLLGAALTVNRKPYM